MIQDAVNLIRAISVKWYRKTTKNKTRQKNQKRNKAWRTHLKCFIVKNNRTA